VWVGGRSHFRKIASFGLHIRRRVAIHGLALNATTPRSAFDPIVPCGLSGCAITSISDESGASPTPAELARPLAFAIANELGRSARWIDSGAIAVRSQLLS
jgi:lipoyl(octanoyl) transferase